MRITLTSVLVDDQAKALAFHRRARRHLREPHPDRRAGVGELSERHRSSTAAASLCNINGRTRSAPSPPLNQRRLPCLREDADVTDADATRLAVLIDSDNTTASLTTELLEEIAKYGTPTIKRAYGDWTTSHLVGWKEELLGHAIQPVQQFSYTRGKNSTDSALIIDAMDLLYAGNLVGFARGDGRF